MLSKTMTASVAIVFALLLTQQATAQNYAGTRRDQIRHQQSNDIFYNYYVDGAGSTPAQMYPSPLPVPPRVGWTYHTYPPLYPHEYMYHHTRSWYTYHPGAGWTRTKGYYSASGGLFDMLGHMHRYGYR